MKTVIHVYKQNINPHENFVDEQSSGSCSRITFSTGSLLNSR